ncbi:hypothetical protein BHE90_003034 [Fusarium euwallaceae]|uniref:Uncharacterized protein n=1 Tax=Fusarium euwallaceae TaxID=1147111 RepID=A0A430M348_9HYPO|nr:hypothetical protein BHE90_003034 [Fusarium euwallaceae]
MAKTKPIRPQPLPPLGQPLEFYPEDSFLPPSKVREFRNYESKRNALFEKKWVALHKKMLKQVEKDRKNQDKHADRFEKARDKDWVEFANKTREFKDKYVACFARQLAEEKFQDQDYQMPKRGAWITFPLPGPKDAEGDRVNGDVVTIAWTSENTTHTARYYRLTCWFGALEYERSLVNDSTEPSPDTAGPPPKPQSISELLKVEPPDDEVEYDPEKPLKKEPEKPTEPITTTPSTEAPQSTASSVQKWEPVVQLKPFGETALFIAAEFIERRYQGAPHLKHLHLRDKFPPGTRWGYLRLDQAFHYGQNYKDPTYRYLVYHPFIRPRHIPQRSFADNIILTTALTIAEAASSSGNAYVATGGAAIGAVVKLIAACNLDPLRRFEPLDPEDMLYDVSKEIETRKKAWNPEPTLLQQTEQVLQISAQLATIDPNKAVSLEISPSVPPEGKQSGTDTEVTLPSAPEGEKPDFLAGAEALLSYSIDKMIEGMALPTQDSNIAPVTYLDIEDVNDKKNPEELVLPPYQQVPPKRDLRPRTHQPPPGKIPKPESQSALQKLQSGNNDVQEQLGTRQSQQPSGGLEPIPNPPAREHVGTPKWRPNPVNRLRSRTFFIVPKKLDNEVLKNALDRLIRNHWRKLGARLVLSPSTKLLEYHVPPSFDENYGLFNWSSTTNGGSIRKIEELSPFFSAGQNVCFLPSMDVIDKRFRPADWPFERKDEPPNAPLLSIHLTIFSDASVLTISCPHVLADQFGVASIVKAWLKVAKGDTPPDMLGYRDDVLPPGHPIFDFIDKESRKGMMRVRGKRDQTVVMAGIVLDLVKARKEESLIVFIPLQLVERLRERSSRTFAEKDESVPDISNGDILTAIFTKMTRQDRSEYALNLSQTVNLRGRVPGLWDDDGDRFIHNALHYATANFNISASTPLHEIALHNRQAINKALERSEIEVGLAALRDVSKRRQVMLICEPFEKLYSVSNWCGAWKGIDFSVAEEEPQVKSEQGWDMLVLGQSRLAKSPGRYRVSIMCKTKEGFWCDFAAPVKIIARIKEHLAKDPLLERL